MNAAFIATSAAPAAAPPGGAAAGEPGAEVSLGAALFSAALGAAVGWQGSDADAADGGADADSGAADLEAGAEPVDETAPAAGDVPVPVIAVPVAAPVQAAPWWFGAAFAAPATQTVGTEPVSQAPAEVPAADAPSTSGAAHTPAPAVLDAGPAPVVLASAVATALPAGGERPAPPVRTEPAARGTLPTPVSVSAMTPRGAVSRAEAGPGTIPAEPTVKGGEPLPFPGLPVASETPAAPVVLIPGPPAVPSAPIETAPRLAVPGVTTAVEPDGVRLTPAPPTGTGTEVQISLQNLPPVEAEAEAAAKPPAEAPQFEAERPIPAAREWAFSRARAVAPIDDAIREPQATPRAAALLTAVLGRADGIFQAPTAFAVPLTPAPAATPALQATMDAQLPSQLIDSIRVLGREGAGEARVRLRPEILGEVTIAIAVHQGAVTASIEAESPAVRQWVETNEGLLREKLAEQGLQLERLSVSHEDAPPESGSRDRRQSRDEEPEAPTRRQRPAGDTPRFEIVL
jgi:flagellar hook-length control protein FliK